MGTELIAKWVVEDGFDMGELHHIFIRCGENIIGRIDGHLNLDKTKPVEHPTKEEAIETAKLIAAAPLMRQTIKSIKLRIPFIGHPEEPMIEENIPDWSIECDLIEKSQSKWEGRS